MTSADASHLQVVETVSDLVTGGGFEVYRASTSALNQLVRCLGRIVP